MYTTQMICLAVLLAPAIAVARPRPDLYPNQYLKSVGDVQANRDVIECEIQADDYVVEKQGSAGKDAARGAVKGAALGALASTITKSNAGRGAGAGAAVGGLSSLLGSKKQQKEYEQQGSPEFRKFMEACLEDKGYRVVGWKQK